jgi:hypothetical protein
MERGFSNVMHIIGLGGAGTNIVESFLDDERTVALLKKEGTRLALLAIDVADPEIKSLQRTYEKIGRTMKEQSIPKERIALIADSVKLPSAEAMFDFVFKKYKEHLKSEGVKLEGYVPWLSSTMAIPPLAGGVGRRRALAKAIYALNYYQLGIIRNFMTSFKEQALSSILTPIVVVVFGMGGGSGSGIVFDFTRHLRKILGSGVPIIGLGILPCQGDDPPAKGVAAFSAMKETSLLVNQDHNEYVAKEFGKVYQNPFNAMILLPLSPAYTKAGNIISARIEMDNMIKDMLYVLMDFDVADLLGGIGTEVGLTDDFVHTMSLVKVTYPVYDYVEAFKVYLEKLEHLRELHKEKLEIFKSIQNIVELKYKDAEELYKSYLVKTSNYVEEQFKEKLRGVIYGSPRFEEDYELYVRGLQEQVKLWIEDTEKFLATIQMVAKNGTIEEAIANLILHREGAREGEDLESLLTHITKTYRDFLEKKAAIFERLKQLIPSSQALTVRQKKILEGFLNITDLCEKSLITLKIFNETRHLTEALVRYYGVIPDSEEVSKELKSTRTELTTLYHLVQLMLRTPADEAKMIDEHLTYLSGMMTKLRDKKGEIDNELQRVQERKKRLEFDIGKIEQQIRKFGFNKKYAKEQHTKLERELAKVGAEEDDILEQSKKLDGIADLYRNLARKIEAVSDYRKMLNSVLSLSKDYQERLGNIIKSRKYFERTSELTEGEQMKIIFKIVADQEESLSYEGILREILDIEHFEDYMKSIIRVFRTPSIMGLKPTYRSDYVWVTAQTPQGLWTEHLTQEILTALAGYVTGEVSKTVTIRVVESKEPWTIRLLVVAGRGKVEDIESYDELKMLSEKATGSERQLSRSFLIEHGVTADELITEIEAAKDEVCKKVETSRSK